MGLVEMQGGPKIWREKYPKMEGGGGMREGTPKFREEGEP